MNLTRSPNEARIKAVTAELEKLPQYAERIARLESFGCITPGEQSDRIVLIQSFVATTDEADEGAELVDVPMLQCLACTEYVPLETISGPGTGLCPTCEVGLLALRRHHNNLQFEQRLRERRADESA